MNNCREIARELMVVERAAWWNPRLRRILKAAPLVVMFLLLNTRKAHATCSFSPAPDPTVDGSSNSLRAAIIAANASGQDCTIQLQAGAYTLTIRNPTSGPNKGQDNTGAYGDLDITDSGHTVTVQGQGAGGSIVNGNGIDRVFQVLGGANAAFKNLTIEGGSAQDNGVAGVLPGTTPAMGGGLLVQDGGHVTLSGVTIKGNQAIGGNGAGPSGRSAPNGPPGQAAEGGGLFLSTGTVDLTDCKISGNTSKGGNGGDGRGGFRRTSAGYGGAGATAAGGGLYVLSGNAGLLRSTLSGNRAAGGAGGRGGTVFDNPTFNGGNGGPAQGAGLFIRKGVLHLAQTTLSNNTATGGGGGAGHFSGQTSTLYASGGSSQGAGIFVVGGNISLENSTVFANAAKGGNGGGAHFCGTSIATCPPEGIGGNAAGGGLYISRGAASLMGVTVASNQALTGFEQGFRGSSFGGGIANGGAISLLTNTTLLGENEQDSGSTANGDDVSGPITASFSLFSQAAGAAITDNGGNIFNVDPALDPDGLRLNGGPTQTVALEIGSPAIDTGDNAVCAAPGPAGLGNIDQRGVARFHHGDNLCDIGAFEFINLLVQPNRLNYGSVQIGTGFGISVYVTNNQTTSVTLSETIGGADPGDFSLGGIALPGNCHGSLAAHASCALLIDFSPMATGKRSGLLAVSDSPDRTSPYQVPLIGIGK